MKTQDLIGKEIIEIRPRVYRVRHDGNIPLEAVDVEMKLSLGNIILFPHHPEAQLQLINRFSIGLKRVFPHGSLFRLLVTPGRFEMIHNQKISGIWQVDHPFGDELCSLELENGSFLAKGPMSPVGLGNADLFLFNSQEEMVKQFDYEIRKVF